MNIAVTFLPRHERGPLPPIAFIGGGNMASAILGGLVRQSADAAQLEVVEPVDDARRKLESAFGIKALGEAGPSLARCELVVWAVKPQIFSQAAQASRPFVQDALHLSVAAGVTSSSIARWLGTERVVRAMPNTPALIGQGMTGLFARDVVETAERKQIEQVLEATGELLWVDSEEALDAVTAVSGSGPAYVFYVLEALTEAGVALGLPAEQAHRLAVGTFVGASALARDAAESPATLRERVTSKGGTTHAAISELDRRQVKHAFLAALRAAHERAGELGREFGT